MNIMQINELYKELLDLSNGEIDHLLDENAQRDIGRFNVFDIAESFRNCEVNSKVSCNRRSYYKVSLLSGGHQIEHQNRLIEIPKHAVIFASPLVPYSYVPVAGEKTGYFCVFTKEFLSDIVKGTKIERLHVFNGQDELVMHLDDVQYEEMKILFLNMLKEIRSDYIYKYDLVRNYLMTLIHLGQKISNVKSVDGSKKAAVRIAARFIELLERQFPIESANQVMALRTPSDFAGALGLHINHLNRMLKDITGKTTGQIIGRRVYKEACILLSHTLWNISEVAYALGFEEVAHFSNFFKKHGDRSPHSYREIHEVQSHTFV